MFLVDHQRLDPPAMLCPFARAGDGDTPTCMGEACALWYQSTDGDYSGCAPFVGAFNSVGTSYHARQLANFYYRRE